MFAEIMALLGMTLSYALRDSVETTVAIDSTLSESTDLEHPTSKNQLSWWGTTRVIKREDVRKLPVRGIQSYIVLNLGVVEQDGNLHVRGGRSDEIGYMIEGVSTRNVLTGQTLTTVIPEALEEVRFQPGVYSARFGLANSGLVNQEFRTGDSVFHAHLSVETDNFTPQYEKSLGTYSYGYSNYVLTLSGPVIDDRVRLFLAAENRFDRDFGVQFLEGFSFSNLRNSNSLTDTIVPSLELKPGNMPGQMRNRYTANGTLKFDAELLKLRLTGAFTSERQQGTMLPVENIFNLRRQPVTRASDLFLKLTGDYALTGNASVNATVFYGDNRSKTFDPDHGDDYMMYEDSVANSQLGYSMPSMWSGPPSLSISGFSFESYGANATRFEKVVHGLYGASVALTTTSSAIHKITIGASYQRNKLRYFSSGSAFRSVLLANPGFYQLPTYVFEARAGSAGKVHNYGYDVFGNPVDKGADSPKEPTFSSFFIEDVMCFPRFTIWLGFRYDVIDLDNFEFIDDPTTLSVIEGPMNPSIDPVTYWYRETGIAELDSRGYFSPRLRFAVNISKETQLSASYSHTVQPPALSVLYTSRSLFAQQYFLVSPPYSPIFTRRDFRTMQTMHIEVGATHRIPGFTSLSLVGFFRDSRDQLGINLAISPYSSTVFEVPHTGEYSKATGFEFAASLEMIHKLRTTLAYTWTDAVGTPAVVGRLPGPYGHLLSSFHDGPLSFNHAHRVVFDIGYDFLDERVAAFDGMSLGALLTFQSGHPYTNYIEPYNSSLTPSTVTVDLRIEKRFSLGKVNADLFLYVQNLFDTKNEINVYPATGKTSDDGSLSNKNPRYDIMLSRYGAEFAALYKAINLNNGVQYRSDTGTSLWGSPRQIRFGVRVDV